MYTSSDGKPGLGSKKKKTGGGGKQTVKKGMTAQTKTESFCLKKETQKTGGEGPEEC